MNILFCGDKSIEDGLIIAIASLLKNTDEPLNILILTMRIRTREKRFLPLPRRTADYLDGYVKRKDPENSVTLRDITDLFRQKPPVANLSTRFTPYCMLRLYIDEIEDMPDRILYLDTDVICRRDIHDFYWQDMSGVEVAGVPDYYGRWFFHRSPLKMDYINSGVLLINMRQVKKTGLFGKCRERCSDRRMFMPDQSSINKLAQSKKLCRRRYNEQRKLHRDTVIQHFTTSFRFFPVIHTVTVKPWQTDRVHNILKLTEYDDILEEYKVLREGLEEGGQ